MMQEKESNKVPLIVIITICLLTGVLANFYSSYAILLVLLPPIALYADIKIKLPITSSIVLISSAAFLYFNWDAFQLFSPFIVGSAVLPLGGYLLSKFGKKLPYYETMFYAVLISLLGIVAGLSLLFYTHNQMGLIDIFVSEVEKYLLNSNSLFLQSALPSLTAFVQIIEDGTVALGIASQQFILDALDMSKIEQVKTVLPYLKDIIMLNSVSIFLIYASISGMITWWFANYFYYRNIPKTPEGPLQKPAPFSSFRVSNQARWLLFLFLIAALFMTYAEGDLFQIAAVGLQNLVCFIILIQGLATFDYLLKRRKMQTAVRFILAVLITVLTLGFAPIILGFLDMFFNLRILVVFMKNKKDSTASPQDIMEQMMKDVENKQNDNDSNDDNDNDSDDDDNKK